MALLTLSQQQQIKSIRTNWANERKAQVNGTNFEQLQKEVEENELLKLLGNAFLLDVQTNPTNPDYIILLDGATFEDCNGNTTRFRGIRYQLGYLNYAQYLLESGLTDSYTGFVQKNRQETQNAPQGALKNQQQRFREFALNDFELMKDYLNQNSATYPLWNCTNKKIFSPKITTIRKTRR